MLDLSAISLDLSIQTRAKTNPATVAEYAERMKAGDKFPPLVVYLVDGKHVLADGFHRLLAATKIGLTAFPAQIRVGTRKDLIAFAVGANTRHGLPRTNADKRRAAEMAVAELADLSDHAIAQACKVSQPFVSKVRKQLKTVISSGKRTGRDGKARKLPAKKAPKTAACEATKSDGRCSPSSTTTQSTAPASSTTAHEEPRQVGDPPEAKGDAFKELWRMLTEQLDRARATCPADRQGELHRRLGQYLRTAWPQSYAYRGIAVGVARGKEKVTG